MEKKRFDYRHYICIAITIGFIACWLLFPNALGRIIESVRDFGLSCAYYFCEIFGIEHTIAPTINDYPKYPFFDFSPSVSSPSSPIPDNFNDFKVKWSAYWQAWASKENFFAYLSKLGNILYYVSYALLIIVPFILLLWLLFRRYLNTHNTDHDEESKPLKTFKRLSDMTYRPAKRFIVEFIAFLKETPVYLKIWACLWAFYFNLFTIFIEFLAFYLYLVVSFDFINIYRQVYKLFLDLRAVIDFLPLWAWIIVGYFVLTAVCVKRGYTELNHHERRNRGFINERGVVTIVYGEMGTGKTALITDMALSAEVELRDMAFEIILESDMHFPNFPWRSFEDELKTAILFHVVYDAWICKRWIRKKYSRWRKTPCKEKIFGYDYERYGLTYDNKLELIDIWKALEDYACAYLIYTVQSSLIVSNYSIRVDSLMSDAGNFPLWNTDFFKRDSRLIDSFSRHSHILDFDMLRLGKIMLKNNPNRNAFGFGVYVVTEIDKERKNELELRSEQRRAADEETNQKNDLFNVALKMSRHAVVIANRVFIKIIGDLQRPEDWGAGGRELGEITYIEDKDDESLTLPFFSPFYFFELLYLWLKSKFDDIYTQYNYVRGDSTLPMYALKNIAAAIKHHYERVYNTFGYTVLSLEVESGRMNGQVKKRKYFRQNKKIWAKRYATNCLSGIWEARGEINRIGIDDLREYADTMATNDELLSQNSYFQSDIEKAKQESTQKPIKPITVLSEQNSDVGYDLSDIPCFNKQEKKR